MNTDTILSDADQGKELAPHEFLFLMKTEGNEEEIRGLADKLNREVNGDVVTFVHNRNVNYTNICINSCLFCGFRRNSKDPGSFVLSVDEILGKIASTPGIKEVCIQGGILPSLSFPLILEMVRAIKGAFPNIHIHAFSPMEIKFFSELSGEPISSVIFKLMDCGLDSIPGTAAEILDDRLRQAICPEKLTTSEWIDVMTTAHGLGLKSTSTILIGHIETAAQVVRHLEILREIQKKTCGFTEFIPLIFVPYTTPLGKRYGIGKIIPHGKLFKFYSLSRIFFQRTIKNIQASWPKLGLENAVKSLFSGVNDLGGTLYEENITSSAGGNAGQMVSIQEVRERVNKTGKTFRLRDTLYNLLPEEF